MASSSKDADIEGAKKPLISSSESKPHEDAIYRQLFLGIVVALPSIAPGMALGFSATVIDQLPISIDNGSWFASIVFLGVAVGCILVNPVMDKFGRKPTLIASNVIGLFGWLFLSVRAGPVTLTKLYIGRFITGISAGMVAGPAAAYASECLSVENDNLRTILLTWSTVALSVGILFSYVMGSLLAYYKVASIAVLISILAFIMVAIFIPESPAWLESKGRSGDAEWAQKQLNIKVASKPSEASSKPSKDSSKESKDSTKASKDSAKPSEASSKPSTSAETPQSLSFGDSLKEFKKPEAYKPLLVMIFFFFFQQFSGVYVLIAYMVDVTRLAGVVILNPYFITIVGGTLILIVSIGASFIYPKTSVRAIACLSGAGMAASFLFIAIYLTIRRSWLIGPTYSFTNFIPLTAFLFNIVCSTIGFLILPWSMMNDVFPLQVKGLATGVTTSLGFLFSFFAIKMFPYLSISLGRSETFYFFGIMSLLGTLFVYAFLPETRGKTLEEVMDSWSKKKPSGQESAA